MALDPRLTALVGTWRGEGTGTLPGMAPFAYTEEIRFEDLGADLAYFQRAWDPASGQTLHAEAGIWRLTADGRLIATIAQARRSEVSEGTFDGGEVRLASTGTGAADGVMPVTSSRRTYRFSDAELGYEYAMSTGAMAGPEQHLAGTLRRLKDPG
jgi:hypothetical protein